MSKVILLAHPIGRAISQHLHMAALKPVSKRICISLDENILWKFIRYFYMRWHLCYFLLTPIPEVSRATEGQSMLNTWNLFPSLLEITWVVLTVSEEPRESTFYSATSTVLSLVLEHCSSILMEQSVACSSSRKRRNATEAKKTQDAIPSIFRCHILNSICCDHQFIRAMQSVKW